MDFKNGRRITVAEMAPHIHGFLPSENKVEKISHWLTNWIIFSLEIGKIKPYDLLPSKSHLAYHIGVSEGTIQNVFRIVEDSGYIESKQRIGTYIKNIHDQSCIEKLTSKRQLAIEIVKKYIVENKYQIDEEFISARKLADQLGMSNSTLRTAYNFLSTNGILKQKGQYYYINSLDFRVEKIQTETLVEKVALKLKKYIKEELKPGDKLPANNILSKNFDASVKTIHDAIKLLAKEEILYVRRGRYGTIVLDQNSNSSSELYFYEKYEHKIKQLISEKYNVGDKLPSIKEFSKEYKVSEKTIKKALDNLAEDGYLAFSRGRYGGTFVLDIPTDSSQAYKWLAITPEYMNN
ncbi:GntR family transcriptional regulator [bacterium]|nr:GntR family transcriptional regulator [bacterium]